MMINVITTKQRLVRLAFATGLLSLVLAVALSLLDGGALAANLFATAPGLGVADSFAVLGNTTVTNTGDTIVNGDLGLSPGTSVTGFPPGIVNGETHIADTIAQNAQSDVTTAYDDLTVQACDEDLTGQDLGGKTLAPGVYCFDSTAQLTGTLTLDAQGDEFSVFIFQIGSTLTTASSSVVNIINAENLCNIFWQVGSSATLNTTTAFRGNILALESITLYTGTTIDGRALAQNGAVTLDTNTITIPVCTVQATPTSTSTATPTSTATSTSTATPTFTATLPPATETAIAATQTAIATQTLQAATQTAQAATQTAIATQTLQAATQTAQAATQTAIATLPAATQTAQAAAVTQTPAPETLPDANAGGDLARPGSQAILFSLGALGASLLLVGFMLSRRNQKSTR